MTIDMTLTKLSREKAGQLLQLVPLSLEAEITPETGHARLLQLHVWGHTTSQSLAKFWTEVDAL